MNSTTRHHRFQVGLLGAGIQFSSSPYLHNTEARALGLDYNQQLLDLDLLPGGVAGFAAVVERVERQGYAGINVTFPIKQQIIPLLHELSAEASALHAVNTVVFRNAKRVGHNTDWWGFAESFKRGLPGAPVQRVAVVGAGGAGAAVAYAILQQGAAELRIHDVDLARSTALAQRMQEVFPHRKVHACSDLAAALEVADGLIHATPMGMAKLPGLAVPEALLHKGLWVADVVYVPLETELLRVARRLGCRTVDGSGMAVYQAAMAIELFTGVKPDAERMRASFVSNLKTGTKAGAVRAGAAVLVEGSIQS
jgi:shikimate dehydrogenase